MLLWELGQLLGNSKSTNHIAFFSAHAKKLSKHEMSMRSLHMGILHKKQQLNHPKTNKTTSTNAFTKTICSIVAFHLLRCSIANRRRSPSRLHMQSRLPGAMPSTMARILPRWAKEQLPCMQTEMF